MSCRWKHLKDQHICVTWELPWRFQASLKFWWAVPQWPMGEEGPCQMACFSARSPAVYSFLWWSWSWLHWYLRPDNGNQMSLLNQARKRVVIKNRALSPLTHHYLRGSPSLKLKGLKQTQESHTWWWYFLFKSWKCISWLQPQANKRECYWSYKEYFGERTPKLLKKPLLAEQRL